jgi:hypothetical protein
MMRTANESNPQLINQQENEDSSIELRKFIHKISALEYDG